MITLSAITAVCIYTTMQSQLYIEVVHELNNHRPYADVYADRRRGTEGGIIGYPRCSLGHPLEAFRSYWNMMTPVVEMSAGLSNCQPRIHETGRLVLRMCLLHLLIAICICRMASTRSTPTVPNVPFAISIQLRITNPGLYYWYTFRRARPPSESRRRTSW